MAGYYTTSEVLDGLRCFDVVGDIEHSKVFRDVWSKRTLWEEQPANNFIDELPASMFPGHLRIRSSSGSSPWEEKDKKWCTGPFTRAATVKLARGVGDRCHGSISPSHAENGDS